MSTKKQHKKRALVIGCGGVAGAAWVIPTLAEVEKKLDWKASDAEILIGTSSGAMLVSLLAAGMTTERMLESQLKNTELKDCVWNHEKDTGGALPPIPKLGLTAPKLLVKGIQGKVSMLTALCGLAPKGNANIQPFVDMLDEVIPSDGWAKHPNTWLMAVDSETGERVALGAQDRNKFPMSKAACASYAIPGWCPPIHINGKTYLDGGIASPSSADFLLGTDVEEVILLAPMASSQPDRPNSLAEKFERSVRRTMTRIVDKEVKQLEAEGKSVIRLEPSAQDLQAIGFNMMDPERRLKVFNTALETAGVAVDRALTAA